MKVLRVQFVHRTPGWAYLAGALAIGLFFLAATRAWETFIVYQRTRGVQAEVATLEGQIVELKRRVVLARQPPPYQIGAAQAVREAQFPLQSALAALENVSVPGVKVTLLNVQLADASAKAEVDFQTPDALAKYLQQLAELPMRHEWRLLKVESESSTEGPLKQTPPVGPTSAQPGLASGTATLVWGQAVSRGTEPTK